MCADITYADDTLLASRNTSSLANYLRRLIETAGKFGLKPNWGKTVHMPIRHSTDVLAPDGKRLKTVTQTKSVVSILNADGLATTAVANRVGEARASFDSLCAMWQHTHTHICRRATDKLR